MLLFHEILECRMGNERYRGEGNVERVKWSLSLGKDGYILRKCSQLTTEIQSFEIKNQLQSFIYN